MERIQKIIRTKAKGAGTINGRQAQGCRWSGRKRNSQIIATRGSIIIGSIIIIIIIITVKIKCKS